MSITQRKRPRSSASLVQRSRGRNHTSGGGGGNTSSRSSKRQTKVTSQGFYFGDAQAAERDVEKIEREYARERKRREQRLEELERGNAPSSSWNDSSSLNIPAASTSAAAIAGLLAGRQAAEQQETGFDDILPTSMVNSSTIGGNKKKQSAELRRLLTQRRSLKLLLEDAAASPVFRAAPVNFVQALHVEQRYPIHRATGPVCSICGYWGDIRCTRCHERVCGLKCRAT